MCTLTPGCKLPRKSEKTAGGGGKKFPSHVKINAENSIYQYEYCSCVVQNILVVPEMLCVNRVWCQCGSKEGERRDIAPCIFAGDLLGQGLVFSFSVCKAPSVGLKGGEASPKVDLEQLNQVSVWISLWRNSVGGVFLFALAIESCGDGHHRLLGFCGYSPNCVCGKFQ